MAGIIKINPESLLVTFGVYLFRFYIDPCGHFFFTRFIGNVLPTRFSIAPNNSIFNHKITAIALSVKRHRRYTDKASRFQRKADGILT